MEPKLSKAGRARRITYLGGIAVLAASLAGCSHASPSANQQASNALPSQQAPIAASQAPSGYLGEQKVVPSTAQIEHQKKVVSTETTRETIPTVRETVVRADINRMDAMQFAALGFPNDVAQAIVQYRDRNGPFQSVQDLANVDGVSQSLLARVDGQLGTEQGQAVSQAGQAGQLGKPGQMGQKGQAGQAASKGCDSQRATAPQP